MLCMLVYEADCLGRAYTCLAHLTEICELIVVLQTLDHSEGVDSGLLKSRTDAVDIEMERSFRRKIGEEDDEEAAGLGSVKAENLQYTA